MCIKTVKRNGPIRAMIPPYIFIKENSKTELIHIENPIFHQTNTHILTYRRSLPY